MSKPKEYRLVTVADIIDVLTPAMVASCSTAKYNKPKTSAEWKIAL